MTNSKLKGSGLKSKKGYTVAELLAVVTILVVISGVVMGIIFSTIRGSSKTKITTEVSQNGQYALSVINGIISNSRNVVSINGATFDDCTAGPSSDTLVPTPAGNSPNIVLKRLDESNTTISCMLVNGTYTVAVNGVSLLNTKSVQASACSFSCSQQLSIPGAPDPYAIPLITVSFKVLQVGSQVSESQASATFKSSTSMRVYSP